MKNTLEYKGYVGNIEYDPEERCFTGKVLGLARTLLLFEGTSAEALITDFEGVIDEYLRICKEDGTEPELPFKGSFNIRIGADRHRAVALEAEQRGISMNAMVNLILDEHFSLV